jgi:BlaI family transcriptional regulator, penicillinase repressor
VDERRSTISETELDVLKVLWEHGPGTVRELDGRLRDRGRRWAYTTVLTLLQRLEAKGYVTSDKSSVAHVFRPTVSRAKLLRRRLKDLADQLCEGTATPLVHALVEGERFSAEEIEEFRRLLDRLQPRKGKGRGETKGQEP